MKKIVALLLICVFSFSFFACSKETEGGVIDDIPHDTTTVPEENTDFSMMQEQQIELYKNYMSKCVADTRKEYGSVYDANMGKRYYAFYDIDGDGMLELLFAEKDDNRAGTFSLKQIDTIVNGKVSLTLFDADIDCSWGNKKAEIFANGVIVCGGRDEDGTCEWYKYSHIRNGVYTPFMYLRHNYLFTDRLKSESWEIHLIDNGGKVTERKITKRGFDEEMSKVEIDPVTGKLEWKSYKEFL
ncbi:MAG: hypothetical protein IK085_08015 [Clostridia bacterium]|nr:hypothetical protein [Clostridia bacterium]